MMPAIHLQEGKKGKKVFQTSRLIMKILSLLFTKASFLFFLPGRVAVLIIPLDADTTAAN